MEDVYARVVKLLLARAVERDDGRDRDLGLVVGVDRDGGGDALKANGADVVVTDLKELLS